MHAFNIAGPNWAEKVCKNSEKMTFGKMSQISTFVKKVRSTCQFGPIDVAKLRILDAFWKHLSPLTASKTSLNTFYSQIQLWAEFKMHVKRQN